MIVPMNVSFTLRVSPSINLVMSPRDLNCIFYIFFLLEREIIYLGEYFRQLYSKKGGVEKLSQKP